MSNLALAIAVKGPCDPARLLAKLRAAGVPPECEIHLAVGDQRAVIEETRELTVQVRPEASLFELWGIAIAACKAPWVAILHADAPPAPGWFAATAAALEREPRPDGYWGPVEPDFGASDPRMVGYLTEYCQFHRPPAPGLAEVPGSNLTLQRSRIGRSADFSKTRLLREGLRPQYVDDALVLYARPFRFGDYCSRRFRHGRAYAAARTPRISLPRAIALTAVLPFVRTGRVLGHALRHNVLRRAALRWLAMIFLAETCWSTGELVGYITRRPGLLSDLD